MSVIPIILDVPSKLFEADYSDWRRGLLNLPAGSLSVAELLWDEIAQELSMPPVVLSSFAPAPDYGKALRERLGRIDIIGLATFQGWLDARGPGDILVFINPSLYPLRGYSIQGILADDSPPKQATFLIALERRKPADELAHLDEQGHVRLIQRYYDGVTHICVAGVLAARLSVSSLEASSECLVPFERLRQSLAARGVPSLDSVVRGAVVDLNTERGVLDMNWHLIEKRGRLFGSGVSVHPTARIFGTVVLQCGSSVRSGAVVLGPTVIGRQAIVGEDAVVAQSVILPNVRVPSGMAVRHQVMGLQTDPARRFAAFIPSSEYLGDEEEWPGISVNSMRAYDICKRLMDVSVTGLALVMLAPLLLVIALAVKLTSRGPILFSHTREGRGGAGFKCYKFRTMATSAAYEQRRLNAVSSLDGPQFRLLNDPRITRVGNLLRRTNLDELPTLINVLLGQMSLVGPRPSPFRENQICVPWRMARLSVRPGITGLWQICRPRSHLGDDFHHWIFYDVLYVRHRSLWLDLRIMCLTVLTAGGRMSVPLNWLIAARQGELASNVSHQGASDTERAETGVHVSVR